MLTANDKDNFKEVFKYFKSNKDRPSLLADVVRFEAEDVENGFPVKISDTLSSKEHQFKALGLTDPSTWKVYSIEKPRGLVLIRNPFTGLGQRYWIRKCLEEFPKKPNRINLDYDMNIEDWWQDCFINNICDRKLQNKLRWTTMGYHHNWGTKVYSEENKSTFPSELADLCNIFSEILGHKRFRAQAAIINYYHMDSTLSPHTDHSEVYLDAPLFSFSFGQSAVFLIGGADKSVTPTAVLLRSGDAVVMSGEARRAYHAVPRILPDRDSPWNCIQKDLINPIGPEYETILDPKEWSPFEDYIKESRINMNVRQVLRENQTSLLDELS